MVHPLNPLCLGTGGVKEKLSAALFQGKSS
jgi:hypothetical protein